VAALETLDEHRLLERFFPEWKAVRSLPQRNAYHRYTVDRHLLETAAQAARLVHRVGRPDLLLVAALLHDIGKGLPGDHTDAGVAIVDQIAERAGLPPDDRSILVTLVRNHLLIAELATRRDLDDPATVDQLLMAVGDRATLELLAALTEADSLATGPAAWSPWKAGLVSELVNRAAVHLSGSGPTARAANLLTDDQRDLMGVVRDTGRPLVVGDPPNLTVVAADRPGLFSVVTGVLQLRGLDVRAANIAGEDGMAVEVFTIEASRGRWPNWQSVAEDLHVALQGGIRLEERLAERSRTYRVPRRTASPAPAPTSVTIDNGASASSTVVEVRTEDGVGLLHRVTKALFECGLDLVAARVSTLGHEVVDAFYVRDRATGGKIEQPERIRQIDSAIRTAADSNLPGS
jgi:[protein-PII] uridylyltransferase